MVLIRAICSRNLDIASAFIRSGLCWVSWSKPIHVRQRIRHLMGDARGHLAQGDDLFLPDHGPLIQPQAFGHGADALVLARQASALAAQVAGDVVGQGDGHEQRKDEAGENEHFGMSARDLAGPGERFDEQTDRGQGAAISQHPRQKQARENHVKNEKSRGWDCAGPRSNP